MANALTEMRTTTTWSVVLSVLMILAGVLAIGAPAIAGVTVTLIVGWMLIFSGVLHIAYAWGAGRARAVIGELLLAVVYGAIGFYLLAQPVIGLASLTVALAIYLVVKGVLEIVLGLQLRPIMGSGWVTLDGVIAILLAVMIYAAWPSGTLWVVGTLVGISMIFSGISRLALAMAVRRAIPA